jgi:hypothetical protein
LSGVRQGGRRRKVSDVQASGADVN